MLSTEFLQNFLPVGKDFTIRAGNFLPVGNGFLNSAASTTKRQHGQRRQAQWWFGRSMSKWIVVEYRVNQELAAGHLFDVPLTGPGACWSPRNLPIF